MYHQQIQVTYVNNDRGNGFGDTHKFFDKLCDFEAMVRVCLWCDLHKHPSELERKKKILLNWRRD